MMYVITKNIWYKICINRNRTASAKYKILEMHIKYTLSARSKNIHEYVTGLVLIVALDTLNDVCDY